MTECPQCGSDRVHGDRDEEQNECHSCGNVWELDVDPFDENGQLWAPGQRWLHEALDEYYGVEGLWLNADYYHEDRDELLYDVLTYIEDGEEHFIAEDVPMSGHGPSGAVCVNRDDLPPQEEVEAAVEEATA